MDIVSVWWYTVQHDGAPSKVRHLSSVASDWQGNVPGGREGSGSILSRMHTYSCACITHTSTTHQGNDEARGQLKCVFLDHHILQTHERTQLNTTQYTQLIAERCGLVLRPQAVCAWKMVYN